MSETRDERNARIIAMAREGATTADLAREFDLCADMIRQILRSTGEAFPGRRYVPPGSWNAEARAARDAEIIVRRRAGAYPRDIAADMGLNISTVFRAIRKVADLPPLPDLRNRTSPAAQQRPPAQYRAKIRRAEGVVMATRTCHACAITIPVEEWSKHLTEVHGYNGKAGKARTALDRYIAQLQPAAEPTRPPEPDCPICKQKCLAPISHGRILRARAQHERKKAA